MKRLEQELEMKNTYMHHYKKDEIKEQEIENELTKTNVNYSESLAIVRIWSGKKRRGEQLLQEVQVWK